MNKFQYILCVIISFSTFIDANVVYPESADKLYIAVACPMTGGSTQKGLEILNGIDMHINEVNRCGGVNGKTIELILFDDQNKTNIGIEKAKEIISSKALLVLGHRSSNVSIAAGDYYKKYKIPAISSTATADLVTKDNDWYFRSIFNNYKQGQIIAYYTKNILKKDNACIIYDEDEYGISLLDAFESSAKIIHLQVDHKWHFQKENTSKDALNKKFKEIVDQIKQLDNIETIFLAVHDVEGVPLVKYIKDSGLNPLMIGAASIGKQSFAKRFNDYQVEKRCPGFYTDGIYATTYFIYDISNQKAQEFRSAFHKIYDKIPGAVSVSSYDIAGIAIDAMKQARVSGIDIKKDRQKIKNYLASMNSINYSYQGISGHVFFDEEGNAVKSVPMAVFNKQKLISAPIQISQITNIREIEIYKRNLREDPSKANLNGLVHVYDQLMRQTRVVYTGVEFNTISELNIPEMSTFLDFYIWFRYMGDMDFNNIAFTNAISPIVLKDPIRRKDGDCNYRLFHIRGHFAIDFKDLNLLFGKHQLGFSFRHKNLSRDHLIFVTDILSMPQDSDKSRVLGVSKDWSIVQTVFFQDTMQGNLFGNPDHIYKSNRYINFSQYNSVLTIEKCGLSIRRSMEKEPAFYVINFTFFVLIILFLISRHHANIRIVKFVWLLQMIFSIVFLISFESYLINVLLKKISTFQLEKVIMLFDVLWWILPAVLIHLAFEHILLKKMERRTNHKVPRLMRSFVLFLLYFVAIVGILAFVFSLKLTSLLATSGVVAMIVGLAIQGNISNIFSGIVINMERPFRIGDWVEIDKDIRGEVVDITWRSTRIRALGKEIICVPNYKAAEAIVRNYHYVEQSYRVKSTLYLYPNHSIEAVQCLLMDAMTSTEDVMDPEILLRIDKAVVQYKLFFSVSSYEIRGTYLDIIHRKILNSLNESNVKLYEPIALISDRTR
jgi:branched-chain amino acid transport system substrate-binding protein